MSAVVAVFVRRTIADSQVEFNTQANSLSEALAIAQQLANGTADAAATTQAAISKAAKESKTSNTNAPATSGNDAGTASTEKSSQPSASTAEKSSDETQPAPALDYEKDIKPRVLLLSKDKGRDATIATLSRFGVAKATELNEDQWPAFLEFVNKVIAGEANPEEALA
ncbi:hypothetical protein ACUXAV_005102 [Cupriavidus metallidurans]|uniref:hypothetical protein n=1 Tax=Cupriavidus metallidurans TaxID=119219 RepID=UPI000493371B|nr:hypothetical protein [Cupriavidus metallidurans]MDE4917758.1 hypothetical protein [Cupriavidus metallidurans]